MIIKLKVILLFLILNIIYFIYMYLKYVFFNIFGFINECFDWYIIWNGFYLFIDFKVIY